MHHNSGDVMILVCHMIFQDNVIKALCDFMGMSSPAEVTILPNLLVIGTVLLGI